MVAYVNDGYTIDAVIKFADGEVKISFRPPIGDEVQRMLTNKTGNEFMSSKLVSWSGMDLEKIKPDVDGVKKLHSRLWGTILDVICGYDLEASLKN